MALSGTVPRFDISTSRLAAEVAVTVTGVQADGQATGTHSNETLQAFYLRGATALSISGTQLVSGVSGTVNGQTITSGQLSGIMQMQREFALRAADLAQPGNENASRLTWANNALSGAGGEVQFGA